MKKGFVAPIVVLILLIALGFIFSRGLGRGGQTSEALPSVSEIPLKTGESAEPTKAKEDIPRISIVASGLEVPWAIAFLPEGGVLITERPGRVRLITKDGELKNEPVAVIDDVRETSEGGLHGIALHPDFSLNRFVYLYYTYSVSGGERLNKVVRMTYENEKLRGEKVIIDGIPGAANHDGGRIKFGPDRLLYITTGDAQNAQLAQDTNSLAGKILRVTDEGSPTSGNPFGNGIYSYGHRNPQGITWDKDGNLWQTEHGPSGFETGNDEFNKIEIGKNYGWPEIRGTQTRPGMVTPILESGRSDTWAPAGLAYLPTQAGLDGKFFFTGLRGQALYEVNVSGNSANLKTYFKGEFGRLREVMVGPDGMLYITTSNRDGRGSPKPGDDKIIRLNPEKL